MFNISLRVENLILKYDTANPYQLAKCLNFDIYELDLPSEIRGFLIRPLRRKCIVLNSNLSELQKQIVLCHEIGHARLHSGYALIDLTMSPAAGRMKPMNLQSTYSHTATILMPNS